MSVLSSERAGVDAGLWYDASTVPTGKGNSVVADLPLQRSGVDLVRLFERFTALEIEAKFRVANRAVFTSLRQLAVLGPFRLVHSPGTERQHNTYFDTADRRLTAERTTLRVRDLGSRRLATVKRSLSSQAGIHIREEWEVDLDAGDHPTDWPASAARDR